MATVAPVYTRIGKPGMRMVSWTLANGDVGDPVDMSEYTDRTVDIGGTFGVGGSVTLRGNNAATKPNPASSATVWAPVTDPQANAITKTSKALEAILEAPRWTSPECTAGDGTTAIVVTMIGRKR